MPKYLRFCLLLTFIFSVMNWLDEGHHHYFLWSTLGAVCGAGIAVLAYELNLRVRKLPQLPFTMVAMFVTTLTTLIYCYYALNGSAENSAHAASHMHILVVPVTLVVSSTILVTLAAMTALFINFIKNNH